ncbi:LysE family translocator [Affinibrenneria salicis]|uniref:LysE family translocator n=1 Tax=Affinibrenneria salicis TaxID=2590031 RepID=A0A5J5FSY8_9GAMM|nr:LysE family translocator [Affinibrenneria salicis]KAA8995602.1 LysE family translocator [Affinibrenneria salicis]
MTEMLVMYAMASLAVTVIPGPTMLLALTNGATKNKKVILMGVTGAALSDFILIGMVAVGLGSLLMASEVLFSLVKWVGVAYLFWLSLQLWRSSPVALAPLNDVASERRGAGRAFMRSLLVALSNPKGLLFFSAFLPQFIVVGQPQPPQYIAFACTSVAIDVAIMLLYAFGGMQAARLFTLAGLRRLNRACAAIMFFLAGGLALYRRS